MPAVTRKVWEASAIAVVVLVSGAAFVWGGRRESNPPLLELSHVVEPLPAASIRIYALSLPHAGDLALELRSAPNAPLNVYLMRPRATGSARPNEFRLVNALTAERTTLLERTVRLERGDYQLVLVNPATDGSQPEVTLVARLLP